MMAFYSTAVASEATALRRHGSWPRRIARSAKIAGAAPPARAAAPCRLRMASSGCRADPALDRETARRAVRAAKRRTTIRRAAWKKCGGRRTSFSIGRTKRGPDSFSRLAGATPEYSAALPALKVLRYFGSPRDGRLSKRDRLAIHGTIERSGWRGYRR
jgi:hypothetical protein